MAQGVAWAAREAGVHATVIAPEHAPRAKLDAVERLGGEIVPSRTRSGGRRWSSGATRGSTACSCIPVEDEAVMAGNGTIGLELCEDLRRVRHRGRAVGRRRAHDRHRERASRRCGRASASSRPSRRPPRRSPRPCARASRREIELQPSFVDGAGGRALLPTMWERGARARRRGGRRPARRRRGAVRTARVARPHRRRRRRRARARRSAEARRPLRLHRQRRQHRPACRADARNLQSLSRAAASSSAERAARRGSRRSRGGVVVDQPTRTASCGYGSFSRRPSEYQLSCAHTP